MAHRALLELVEAVMDNYFEMSREAEAAREEETAAAVVLQSAWRGKLQRILLRDLEHHAVSIQRHWRGHIGRRRAAAAREARDRSEREAYFRAAATTIQRHWRGYWSRKHLHSLAARRAFLTAASEASAAARRAMDEACAHALEAASAGRAATALEAFERQVKQLHHLASTQAVPGIFSPPFEAAAGLVPVVEGLTIEEHLKRASKMQVAAAVQQRMKEAGQLQPRVPPERASPTARLLRPKRPSNAAAPVGGRGGLGLISREVAAGSGVATKGRLPPVVAAVQPTAATTLRQAAPYNAVQESLALERRVDKAQIAVLHRHPFVGPSAVVNIPFIETPTVRGADAFRDSIIGGIPGARGAPVGMGGAAAAAAVGGGVCAVTGRLFDVTGRSKGFFDSSLREGY